MKSWVSFHNHTIFSKLDGLGRAEQYAARAKELGMPGIACTDHGHVWGILDHYDACVEHGVKPILGAELYQARKTRFDRDDEERSGPAEFEWQQRGPYHLTVVARNNIGYKNLIKLSSRAYLEGYYVKPRIDHDLISQHADGLMVFSGCLGGEVQQALLRGDYDYALNAAATMQSIVGKDNYFVEMHDHNIEEERRVREDLIKIAKAINAPIVPTGDCHYVYKEEHDVHDAMLCQPPGTMVLVPEETTPRVKGAPYRTYNYVPIEDIKIGDKVVSWDNSLRRGRLNKAGSEVTNIGVRHYSGDLVEVETETGAISRYTPDHICVARLDGRAEGGWVVYLMKKGNSYRVGKTQWQRKATKMLGLSLRVKEQEAEAAWILSFHEDEQDACLAEITTAYQFGIPTVQFYSTRTKANSWLPKFWDIVGDNTKNAIDCLDFFGRDIRFPFWDTYSIHTLRRPSFIRACNLIDGMLVCQIDSPKETYTTNSGAGVWKKIKINRVAYSGPVYSMDVAKQHTYIADKVVTHNCVGTKSFVADEDRFKFAGPEFYLKSYDEMLERFEPEWLKNSLDAADRCEVNLEFGEYHFPNFPDTPKEKAPADYLEELTWEGVHAIYGTDPSDEVKERTSYELQVIKDMGFPEYFLVVSDIIKWAKSQGIRIGYGRGSAASSIVSYALEITNIDPVKFGLLFERFLVPGRKTMPDIDIDIDTRYRGVVIDYVREKYGHDHVAHIVTYTRIGAKTAIRDTARVLGYEASVGDRIAKMVPDPVLGVSKTLKECLETPEMRKDYDSNPDTKKILDSAIGLEGLIRQTGVHAAGVVVSDKPIIEHIPVMTTSDNGEMIVTQWDMHSVDRNGMLKIDFLGLRNLDVISECEKLVRDRHNIDFSTDGRDFNIEDELTFKEMCKGNTKGMFQIESDGMRDMILRIQPESLWDIMATISLFRPGPLGSGMHNAYINRKHKREEVHVPHESLEGVLDRSLGIMLYQEDVINVIRIAAGWDVSEADDLRRVMGKKKMSEVSKYRPKFVEGCIKTSGMPKAVAEKLYTDIEYFAGYGFNMAHAISYAMVSYVTGYLKTHYPVEYMAALLSSVTENPDRLGNYLKEAEAMDMNILPPSINDSDRDFSVVDDKSMRFGLGAVKGIGSSVIDKILSSRTEPYETIYDFFRRIHPELLNKGVFEKLLYSGALDDLSMGDSSSISNNEKRLLLTLEKQSLGVYLTEHPMKDYESFIESQVDTSISDVSNMMGGRSSITIGGIIGSVEKKNTRNGKVMYFFTLEDSTGTIKVIVFPKDADKFGEQIKLGDIVLVDGRVTIDRGNTEDAEPITVMHLTNIRKPDLPSGDLTPPIFIELETVPSCEILDSMIELMKHNPGKSPVYVKIKHEGKVFTLKGNMLVNPKVKDNIQKVVDIIGQ